MVEQAQAVLVQLDPKWSGRKGSFMCSALLISAADVSYVPDFIDGKAEVDYYILVDLSPWPSGINPDRDIAGISAHGYLACPPAEDMVGLRHSIATVSVDEWEILSRFARQIVWE